ncbi:hypothetical protein M5K25_018364 [Dendrobium thyrsiflorum]|uniref:RNase H type-1 domain-containing protein n=1 Tax=Dendrobium thyrsiflorum TaxID=117978 RepID=A0ABD0UPX2_DENTH
MDDFNATISDCNLHDISFSGRSFMWNRALLWQRLDRILFNSNWISSFPMSHVEHLSRTISDHSPLLLSINTSAKLTSTAFRFQNMWLLDKSFKDIILDNWQTPIFPDNNIKGMTRLWSKLSRLKQKLRWWNKTVFKNLFSNIKEAEVKVSELDKIYIENSSSKNLRAGGGGLIRNHLGEVLLAFAAPLNPCNAITAELMALDYGLQLCSKLGIVSVWIEVDVMLIIQFLNNMAQGNVAADYLAGLGGHFYLICLVGGSLWGLVAARFPRCYSVWPVLYVPLVGCILVALQVWSVVWKRDLGLVVWYQLPPNSQFQRIINTYEPLLSDGRAPLVWFCLWLGVRVVLLLWWFALGGRSLLQLWYDASISCDSLSPLVIFTWEMYSIMWYSCWALFWPGLFGNARDVG